MGSQPAQCSLVLLGLSDLNFKNFQVQKTVVGQWWVWGGGGLGRKWVFKGGIGYSSGQVCKAPLLL